MDNKQQFANQLKDQLRTLDYLRLFEISVAAGQRLEERNNVTTEAQEALGASIFGAKGFDVGLSLSPTF